MNAACRYLGRRRERYAAPDTWRTDSRHTSPSGNFSESSVTVVAVLTLHSYRREHAIFSACRRGMSLYRRSLNACGVYEDGVSVTAPSPPNFVDGVETAASFIARDRYTYSRIVRVQCRAERSSGLTRPGSSQSSVPIPPAPVFNRSGRWPVREQVVCSVIGSGRGALAASSWWVEKPSERRPMRLYA